MEIKIKSVKKNRLSSVWCFPGCRVVKNPPGLPILEMWKTLVQSLGREDPLDKEMATHSSILACRIPGQRSLTGYSPWGHKSWTWFREASLVAQMVKESACNAGDLGSIPGLGRSPGEGHGNPLQYSCLENPHGQRSLVGYSPWGHKELDMTEWLSTCPRWRDKIKLQKNN